MLFPAHLYHAVAPVVSARARYAVTIWLSLRERAETLDTSGLSAVLDSSGWLDAYADYSQLMQVASSKHDAAARVVVDAAQRAALEARICS